MLITLRKKTSRTDLTIPKSGVNVIGFFHLYSYISFVAGVFLSRAVERSIHKVSNSKSKITFCHLNQKNSR